MKLSTAVFLCSCAALLEGSTIRKPRIVNGEEANPGQFPWEVGVVRVKSSLLYYCAGAIIGEEWILTSAYCVDQAESLMVIYGTNDLEDTDASFSLSKNYFIHDGFDNSALRSNIALVRLNESLTFNDKVQAIALSDEELGAGVEVTVSGWGHTSDDDNSDMYDVLRYVKVTTIDNSRCQEVYGNDVILPEMVCTDNGVPAKGPCSGDGGDPVVVDVDGNPVLVAIFSFVSNLGCESALPAGYTRTAYYKDWIKEISGI